MLPMHKWQRKPGRQRSSVKKASSLYFGLKSSLVFKSIDCLYGQMHLILDFFLSSHDDDIGDPHLHPCSLWCRGGSMEISFGPKYHVVRNMVFAVVSGTGTRGVHEVGPAD